jgi:AmmeMemoRadiSam system protein A
MLQIASAAIVGRPLPRSKTDDDDWLDSIHATFVTLWNGNRIRGCIGSIVPHAPLGIDIWRNARLAASVDRRFTPIPIDELNALTVEISVLSQISWDSRPPRIAIRHIEPFKHGVLIEANQAQTIMLPQMWIDFPSKRDFFSALFRKAGVRRTSWDLVSRVGTYEVACTSGPLSLFADLRNRVAI